MFTELINLISNFSLGRELAGRSQGDRPERRRVARGRGGVRRSRGAMAVLRVHPHGLLGRDRLGEHCRQRPREDHRHPVPIVAPWHVELNVHAVLANPACYFLSAVAAGRSARTHTHFSLRPHTHMLTGALPGTGPMRTARDIFRPSLSACPNSLSMRLRLSAPFRTCFGMSKGVCRKARGSAQQTCRPTK